MAATPHGDELLVLEREEAVDRHFDERNLRVLRRLVGAFAIVAVVYTIALLVGRAWVSGAIALADAVVLVVIRRRIADPPRVGLRTLLVAVAVGEMAVILTVSGGTFAEFGPWPWIFVFFPLAFRLRLPEYLAMLAGFLVLVAGSLVLAAGAAVGLAELPTALESGVLFGYVILEAMVLAAALWTTGRRRREFLGWWEREVARHRDRLRMKEELELAREVQLGMLPRSGPDTEWLDVASLSLPATEVGGDYYDYFRLSSERLGVVVADVAGHGVASGLVLSGVRSGLNLLEEHMDEPVEVLGRLHRMLRRTDNRRMIVTLVLAVFDGAEGTLTVASAGHPPIIRRRATGEVDELLLAAPPLGALADPEYGRTRVDLAPHDLVVLYSDGLTETCNPAGEPYGGNRLVHLIENLAPSTSAREARDALLRDVWDFKGEAAQVDDVTMVVARVLERRL